MAGPFRFVVGVEPGLAGGARRIGEQLRFQMTVDHGHVTAIGAEGGRQRRATHLIQRGWALRARRVVAALHRQESFGEQADDLEVVQNPRRHERDPNAPAIRFAQRHVAHLPGQRRLQRYQRFDRADLLQRHDVRTLMVDHRRQRADLGVVNGGRVRSIVAATLEQVLHIPRHHPQHRHTSMLSDPSPPTGRIRRPTTTQAGVASSAQRRGQGETRAKARSFGCCPSPASIGDGRRRRSITRGPSRGGRALAFDDAIPRPARTRFSDGASRPLVLDHGVAITCVTGLPGHPGAGLPGAISGRSHFERSVRQRRPDGRSKPGNTSRQRQVRIVGQPAPEPPFGALQMPVTASSACNRERDLPKPLCVKGWWWARASGCRGRRSVVVVSAPERCAPSAPDPWRPRRRRARRTTTGCTRHRSPDRAASRGMPWPRSTARRCS